MKYGRYYLMGTDKRNCAVGRYGNSLPKLRQFGATLKGYAIYHEMVNGRHFHNATDPAFLIEYHNDTFWENVKKHEEKTQA